VVTIKIINFDIIHVMMGNSGLFHFYDCYLSEFWWWSTGRFWTSCRISDEQSCFGSRRLTSQLGSIASKHRPNIW